MQMEKKSENADSQSCLYKARATFVIDPQNFWAQIASDESFSELKRFENLIQEHCLKQHKQPKVDFHEEFIKKKMIFVKSPTLGKWLRAEAARKVEDKVDVFYYDYGNVEMVPLEFVCMDVPPHFLAQPPFAYRFQMMGIVPIAKSWTSRAVKYFRSKVLDKVLDALILPSATCIYGTCDVSLYAGPEQNHRSITHMMLEEDVGLPMDIEDIPEFSHQITSEWYQQMFAAICPIGVSEDQTVSENDGACVSSPESDTLQPPSLPLRIPSFDTDAIETGHNVTPEVLKITSVIESQKSNRKLYKEQMKEVESDNKAEMELYGVQPKATCPSPESPSGNIVNKIQNQIRQLENNSPTSDEQDENKPPPAQFEPVLHKSRSTVLSGKGHGSSNRHSSSDSGQRSPRYHGSPRHSPGPPIGRGRARNKNASRSSSNSPVYSGPHRKSPDSEQNYNDKKRNWQSQERVKQRSPLSPQSFLTGLHKRLDAVAREGLEKHSEDVLSFIMSNQTKRTGEVVLETLLEKAVKNYEKFCPAAVAFLKTCQGLDNFDRDISSVFWKLQNKYVKVTSKPFQHHLNYCRVLAQVFEDSLTWEDSSSLSVKVCVINILQKWIIFSKSNPTNQLALQEVFIDCFLELWVKIEGAVQSSMLGEWKQLIDEMKQRILSDLPKPLKLKLLDALLISLSNEDSNKSIGHITIGSQTDHHGSDVSTQTIPKSYSDVYCQSNSDDKTREMLLTPEELVRRGASDLTSPDQFVVPRFTVPVSPEILSNDNRLSPIPLVYRRKSTDNCNGPGEVSSPSYLKVSSRGRGSRLNSYSKPFFDPIMSASSAHSRVIPPQANYSQNNSKPITSTHNQPQLMTPDLFATKGLSDNVESCGSKEHSLKVGSNSPFVEIINPVQSSSDSNQQQNQASVVTPKIQPFYPNTDWFDDPSPENVHNKLDINTSVSNCSVLQTDVKKPEKRVKKKQLVDLSTGQIIVKNKSVEPTVSSTVRVKPASPSTFSYASIVTTVKQASKTEAIDKSPLTMKSIAMDLLKEPDTASVIPNAEDPSSNRSEITGNTADKKTCWFDGKSAQTWAVNESEFPSLGDTLKGNQINLKRTDGSCEELACVSTSKTDLPWPNDSKASCEQSYGAFSENDDTDDDWDLGTFPTESLPAAPKPVWVPGPRTCTICGETSHLIYDCPKKNHGIFL